MKSKLFSVLVISLFSFNSFALENCEAVAKKAALYLSRTINKDARPLSDVTTVSNSSQQQVVEVVVDEPEGGAHVGYTVTVERNPSPIEAHQTCSRVTKIELTSEE